MPTQLTRKSPGMTDALPLVLATVTYPDGSELTAEYCYTTADRLWMGLRLPGETRIDEYPADLCRVWDSRQEAK